MSRVFSQKEIEDCQQNLQELMTLAKAIAPTCQSVKELIELCEFACLNSAACKLVLFQVEAGTKK